MAKTITIRLDDEVYELFKKAAHGDRRTISNFVEFATLSYLTDEVYVSDQEMDQILNDPELTVSLRKGLKEAKKGRYSIVE